MTRREEDTFSELGREEYLTISEVAERLRWSAKSVRNRMAQGVFREGIHFFRRKGIGPRFKWSKIVAWLEGGDILEDAIPMARKRGRIVAASREERV